MSGRSARAARPSGAGLTQVAELHARAINEHNQGHPLAALRMLRRALRLLERRPDVAASDAGRWLAAAIWISLGLNEAEVNGPEPGLVALAEGRRRAAAIG